MLGSAIYTWKTSMRPKGLALFFAAVIFALQPFRLGAKVLTVTLSAEPYAGINSLVSVDVVLDSIPEKVTIRLYRLLNRGGRQLSQEFQVINRTDESQLSSASKGHAHEIWDREPSSYVVAVETVLFLPLGRYVAIAEAPDSQMIESKEPFDTTQFLRVMLSRSKAPREPATFAANPRSAEDDKPGFTDGIVGTIQPLAVEASTNPVLRWRYELRAPAEAYVYIFDETGAILWERRTKGASIRYDGPALKHKLPLHWIVGAGNGTRIYRFENLPVLQPGG